MSTDRRRMDSFVNTQSCSVAVTLSPRVVDYHVCWISFGENKVTIIDIPHRSQSVSLDLRLRLGEGSRNTKKENTAGAVIGNDLIDGERRNFYVNGQRSAKPRHKAIRKLMPCPTFRLIGDPISYSNPRFQNRLR